MATMQWEFVVALIVAIPLILFPAAFVWQPECRWYIPDGQETGGAASGS